MHGSLCRQELSFGVIEVFFREGIQGDERLDPVEIGFGCRMRSLAGIERGFCFIDLNLKRAGIDLEVFGRPGPSNLPDTAVFAGIR